MIMIGIRFLVAVGIVVLLGSMASASEITYLASSLETLYRVTPDREIESWDFPGIKLRGMHRDSASGDIFVVGDAGGAGARATVYTLEHAVSGTPTLTPYAQLSRQYGSLTRIGETFYAFSSSSLYTIDLSDPSEPAEQYLGSTGILGAAGAAYDPRSDTLYMTSFKYGIDALYTIDRETTHAMWHGLLGIDAYDLGAEWFDGQLYAAAQNGYTQRFEIGTVDVETGHYAAIINVADGADFVATALTVIPEPATLGLLLAGGLVAPNRRRPKGT